MDNKEIETRVMETVARIFNKDPGELTRETRFVEDLRIKSLNFIELNAVLEDFYGIDIPMGEARKRKNLGEAIDLVADLIRKKGGG